MLIVLLLVPGILLAGPKKTEQPAHSTHHDVSGRWTVTADIFRTPLNLPLELKQEGDQLTGEFAGSKLTGTVEGNSIRFLVKDERTGTREAKGTLTNDVISGTLAFSTPGGSRAPAGVSVHSQASTNPPHRASATP